MTLDVANDGGAAGKDTDSDGKGADVLTVLGS